MARSELIREADADREPGGPIIDAYLAALAVRLRGPARLRREIIEEIEDGIAETVAAAVAEGSDPEAAAQAAIAEFGDPAEVAAAYAPELGAHRARRVALGLLVTGPVVGLLWLAAVAPSTLPPWRHVGGMLDAAFGLIGPVLVVAVPAAILAVVVTGQVSRWLRVRSRVPSTSAALAAGAAGMADVTLLIGYAMREAGGNSFHTIAALAVAASFVRLFVAGRAFLMCLAAIP